MRDFNIEIRYLKRSRNVTLRLLPERLVRITAPKGVTSEEIEKIIEKKTDWILKKYSLLESAPVAKKIEFVNDEKIPYLGKELTLKITDTAILLQNGDYLYAPQNKTKQRILEWYQEQALERIKERAKHFADLLGVQFRNITIKNYKARWGACSSKGDLILNWQIICFSPELFDYVIAHEICHLNEMNHGPKFYRHLQSLGFKRADYHRQMRYLKNVF